MPSLTDIDPDGLLEYSVVFSDRSLNHMSQTFQQVMREISENLRTVYNGEGVALVPGGGTFGMEAVARQFGTGKKCLVIRNGWFSYRWSQIFEAGSIPSEEIVVKARPTAPVEEAAYIPPPIEEIVRLIEQHSPDVVFAPHVETSSGMILSDDYLKEVAAATNSIDGLFVLDCIASGTMWVDMHEIGVDILITAPQKGWSASPCSALVILGERAKERIAETNSTSFAGDLKKWLQIMETYEAGGHAYHATMPTDGIVKLHSTMLEMRKYGFQKLQADQVMLGKNVRTLFDSFGFKSLASKGYEAPGVVVFYTQDAEIQNGKKFALAGLQTAAGVPLMCDEPSNFQTFRIGLFGLEKLSNIERTVANLEKALEIITGGRNVR